MSSHPVSRRNLLKAAGAVVPCGALLGTDAVLQPTSDSPADYSLTIAT